MAKASHQQFDPRCVCNVTSFATYMQRMSFVGEFCGGCSNNNSNSKIRVASKVRKSCSKDPIVKLGSFGHYLLKCYAYFSSPWACAIIPIKVMGNCLNPNIILLHTCNLGCVVFAWSILSWLMHRNSSFNCTNSLLQVWYKFLYDFLVQDMFS